MRLFFQIITSTIIFFSANMDSISTDKDHKLKTNRVHHISTPPVYDFSKVSKTINESMFTILGSPEDLELFRNHYVDHKKYDLSFRDYKGFYYHQFFDGYLGTAHDLLWNSMNENPSKLEINTIFDNISIPKSDLSPEQRHSLKMMAVWYYMNKFAK